MERNVHRSPRRDGHLRWAGAQVVPNLHGSSVLTRDGVMAMVAVLLTLLAGAHGTPPDQMAVIVSDRLSRLDNLTIEVVRRIYDVQAGKSPLDPNAWEVAPDDIIGDTPFPYRLTIHRPNVLCEFLMDREEWGYVPLRASVFDGQYIHQQVRPDRFGRATYSVVPGQVQAGIFGACPLLQIFDIHIYDSPIAYLNLARLFSETEVRLVRFVGGVSTYVASLPLPGNALVFHYEFDLDPWGTPLRFKTIYEYPDAQPSILEQFTLEVMEVNSAWLPTDTVTTGWLSIDTLASMPEPIAIAPGYTVQHFQVTSVQSRPDLVPEAVRIEPDRRNARVATYYRDGTVEQIVYDEAGQIVDRVEFFAGTQAVDPLARYLPHDALRWRLAVPVVAVGLGLAAMLTLRGVSRRHASL
jgi:hypothetical protein